MFYLGILSTTWRAWSTSSGRIMAMQWRWHLAMSPTWWQGAHSTTSCRWTTNARSPSGAHRGRRLLPSSTTSGLSNASATCIGPVLTEITGPHLASSVTQRDTESHSRHSMFRSPAAVAARALSVSYGPQSITGSKVFETSLIIVSRQQSGNPALARPWSHGDDAHPPDV